MTKRSGRVGAGVAIALSIAFPAAAQTGQSASGYKAPVISDTGRLQGPRQPIFFRHDIHAGQDQIPCLYCHKIGRASCRERVEVEGGAVSWKKKRGTVGG